MMQTGKKQQRKKSSYYRVAKTVEPGKVSDVEDYFNSGKIQMKGTYSSLSPEVKNGLFIYFYENGNKKSEVIYENNKIKPPSKYWKEDGTLDTTNYVSLEKQPVYRGGMSKFYNHMSDSSITIVPKQSNYPKAEEKAQELLSWLVSRNIVKNSISDCILSKNGEHAIAEGTQEITNEPEYLPYDLLTNGLEIETGRQVFDNGENGIDEIICPSCRGDILQDEWDLSDWHEGKILWGRHYQF